jgi:hypothetical protein
MHDLSVRGRTIAATATFAVFMVLFTLLRDVLGGQPFSLVGPMVSGLVGAVVFGVIFYVLLERRSRVNGA